MARKILYKKIIAILCKIWYSKYSYYTYMCTYLCAYCNKKGVKMNQSKKQSRKEARRVVSKILNTRRNFEIFDDLADLVEYKNAREEKRKGMECVKSLSKYGVSWKNSPGLFCSDLMFLLEEELQKEHTVFETVKLVAALSNFKKVTVNKNSKNRKNTKFAIEFGKYAILEEFMTAFKYLN